MPPLAPCKEFISLPYIWFWFGLQNGLSHRSLTFGWLGSSLHDSQFLAVVSPGSYKKAKDSARHPQRRLPAVSECLGTCCHANCWSAAACGSIESPRPQRSRWWMKERLWIPESTSLTRSIRYFTALDISIHGIMPIVHYHYTVSPR